MGSALDAKLVSLALSDGSEQWSVTITPPYTTPGIGTMYDPGKLIILGNKLYILYKYFDPFDPIIPGDINCVESRDISTGALLARDISSATSISFYSMTGISNDPSQDDIILGGSKDIGGGNLACYWIDFLASLPLLPDPATSPDPTDTETNVSISKILSWTAGALADSHDVRLGTSSPPGFIGNQLGTTYTPPSPLTGNQLYYWRIDEVNGAGTTTGDEWTFTTEAGLEDLLIEIINEVTFQEMLPSEELLIESTNEVTTQEFYTGKGIIFGFDDTDVRVDSDVHLAIRGKQISGIPNGFLLCALIQISSIWYSLDTFSYETNWSTVLWEELLSRKLTQSEMNSIQVMIIPEDHLNSDGASICEIRLFVIEPKHELFDVSLTVENDREYDFINKEKLVKVYH